MKIKYIYQIPQLKIKGPLIVHCHDLLRNLIFDMSYVKDPPPNLKAFKDHRHVDGQAILTFTIKGEDVDYIYDKKHYGICECGHATVQFNYLSSNNSLNVYCDNCWSKYPKSLSKLKSPKRRNDKHQYFADHQRKANRHFCEVCLTTEYPLQIHHIIEVKDGGLDDVENLSLLCDPCHTIVHRLRNLTRRTR